VGGVLVDEDEAVLGLGDDIGGGDLAPGDSEREASRFGRRGEGGFAAGLGGEVVGGLRIAEAVKPLPFRGGVWGGACLSE
jgi:hypothetical protein